MKTPTFIRLCSLAMLLGIGTAQAGVVVIGHPGIEGIDAATVRKIYKSAYFELGGKQIRPADLPPEDSVRKQFLRVYLNYDEYDYQDWWTLKTANAEGARPSKFRSAAEVIKFVEETPGAIGYIDEADVRSGLNILLGSSDD